MNLAVINKKTNIVENVIVPPKGSQVYFANPEYLLILSNDASIGSKYDEKTKTFSIVE